uniref:Zinc finger protein n=1 Tax=Triticum aestivum TaxID=4565 RepID=Q84YG4_WHEAT|nr:zinc finger protein [Triticum aestivum]
MIQERGDYKSLDPADILERLNTHEFQLDEKRDIYGSSYGRSCALKAKEVSESEGEDSGSSLGDPEELSQELELLAKKFQKFSRRGHFGKSLRSNDSSSSDYKKRLCHKCKKPGHYIQDCPQWEKESKTKYKDYSSDDAKKKKSSKYSSSKSSKSSSHKKSSSKKARAFIGKEMDSKAEEHEDEEESEESESGVASLALATAFISKSIFNSEENGFTNKADEGNDDYTPTYCFMAKGAKVLKYPSSESSEDESDENLKPSYSKLAKIAVK